MTIQLDTTTRPLNEFTQDKTLSFPQSLPPSFLSPSRAADGIPPEDFIDEEEVIQTQPTTDYQAIDDEKQPIAL